MIYKSGRKSRDIVFFRQQNMKDTIKVKTVCCYRAMIRNIVHKICLLAISSTYSITYNFFSGNRQHMRWYTIRIRKCGGLVVSVPDSIDLPSWVRISARGLPTDRKENWKYSFLPFLYNCTKKVLNPRRFKRIISVFL